MSNYSAYTIELYKVDRRIKKDERYGKNKVGLRFVEAKDFEPQYKGSIKWIAYAYTKAGYVVKVFETYVTRKNMMTGAKYQERYDTPNFCSPSSESFWSM